MSLFNMSTKRASVSSISDVGSEEQFAETPEMEKSAFERLPEDIILQ